MSSINRITLFFLLTFVGVQNISAQANGDFYRSTGKIYVVAAVIGLIFVGIISYLIYLDMRLRKMEQDLDGRK